MEKITIPGLSPYYGPTTGFSRAFQAFIREIGDCRSRSEEDRIIRKEANMLKDNLDSRNIQNKQMKENLMRMIYCEMLGHDASFGFIHAVNYTQKEKLMDKRIGYLACCLLLHENDEMTLLLMNTIQKDLKSSNIMENCIALIAVTRLVNKEMVPALLPLVSKLMEHKRDIVRKKAVMAAFWFYQLDPSLTSNLQSMFEKTLCDRSPAVMGTTLNVYLKLIEESPKTYKRFAVTFVNILKQVMEFRLSNDFTYCNVPAPWIQIKLLRILAYLGHDDERASEVMYEVLKECLASTYIDNNIGCAVLSECLRTSVTIFPNNALTDLAARKVGLLIVSENNNLKYIGISILAHLIEVDVSYAFRHQMTVIDCLNDPDDTLKRKTLVLLYRMANASNVAVICDKMINYLRSSVDEYIRSDLVNRITTLAEKFAPDNEWLIETMNTVFELGGDLVESQVAQNLMKLIGEGTDDETLDNDLRLYAVNSYLDLIDKQPLPDVLIQLICWVVGEYSYLATHCEPEEVMEKLCSLFKRHFSDSSTKPWVVTAITKIVAQKGNLPDEIRRKIEEQLSVSSSMEVKQRCAELLCLLDVFPSLDDVLPRNASFENLEVDSTLSFLDEFVADALARGAAPYKPKEMRELEKQRSEIPGEKKLNTAPYPKFEKPSAPAVMATENPGVEIVESQPVGITSPAGGKILPTSADMPVLEDPKIAKKQVWGPSGYIGEKSRSGSVDQYSDSSSTTSSVESGSTSSGKIVTQREDTPLSQPMLKESPQYTEKIKLAEQLFAQSPRSDNFRPERAGFSRRQKTEPGIKAAPQDKKEEAVPAINKMPELLLDLSDSEASEAWGREQPGEDNFIKESDRTGNLVVDATNESLLEGLVIGDDTEAELYVEQVDDIDEGSNSKQRGQSTEEQTSPNDLLINGLESIASGVACDAPIIPTSKQEEDLLGSLDTESPKQDLLDSSNPEIEDAHGGPVVERSVPELPEGLKEYIASDTNTICEDINLKVSTQKVYTPDALTVVLYLINQSSFILKEVCLNLQAPSNVVARLGDSADTAVSFVQIDGYKLERCLLKMEFKSPSLHMVIGGHLSYKDSSNTERRLFMSCPVIILDFIRPLNINIQAYGQKWKSMSYEKKLAIDSKATSQIQEVCQIVKEKFNFHVVEIIGNEAISAGTINTGQHCLLHCNCLPNAIEFRLKTPSTLLNDSIIDSIKKLF